MEKRNHNITTALICCVLICLKVTFVAPAGSNSPTNFTLFKYVGKEVHMAK